MGKGRRERVCGVKRRFFAFKFFSSSMTRRVDKKNKKTERPKTRLRDDPQGLPNAARVLDQGSELHSVQLLWRGQAGQSRRNPGL